MDLNVGGSMVSGYLKIMTIFALVEPILRIIVLALAIPVLIKTNTYLKNLLNRQDS